MARTISADDQIRLNMSLHDACKIARRLSRNSDSEAHAAVLQLIRTLRARGAKDAD